jgi:hypothetical protein
MRLISRKPAPSTLATVNAQPIVRWELRSNSGLFVLIYGSISYAAHWQKMLTKPVMTSSVQLSTRFHQAVAHQHESHGSRKPARIHDPIAHRQCQARPLKCLMEVSVGGA